jgi:hypothetical protein
MTGAFMLGGARTPVGRAGGSLSHPQRVALALENPSGA